MLEPYRAVKLNNGFQQNKADIKLIYHSIIR